MTVESVTCRCLQNIHVAMKNFHVLFWLGIMLKNLYRRWLGVLSGSSELEVWHSLDRFGKIRWHVYDFSSGRSAYLNSEAEVRRWLDERYYQ